MSVICSFMIISCKDDEITLITENKSYMLINENSFDLIIYIEDSYSFYLEPENIDTLYLKDKINKYDLTVNTLTKKEGKLQLDDKELSQYNLNVTFNYKMDKMFKIPKCKIELISINNDSVELDIGSFTYLNILDNNNLVYTSAYKGIINDLIYIDDVSYPTIVGTILSINNANNNEIYIKNIIPINGHLEVQQNKIELVDNIDIANNTPIEELLNTEYDLLYNKTSDDFNFLMSKDKQSVLLPISYTNVFMTNNIMFLIIYEIDNNVYYDFTPNMILFNSTKLNNNFNIYVIN